MIEIILLGIDNNLAILTKKKDRRDWNIVDVARSFKIKSFETSDNPKEVLKVLYKNIFKGPQLINIHTNRLYWHTGAGKDQNNTFDRLKNEIKILGKSAVSIDKKIQKRIERLWELNSDKL